MKKVILTIITILFVSSISISQPIRDWGIKLGIASSSQHWDYGADAASINFNQNPQNKIGLDAGLFIEWFHDPHFSLLTELRYIQKGFKDEETSQVYDPLTYPSSHDTLMTFKPSINYLSIPIVLKYRFELGPVDPYFILGPRIDFLVSTQSDGLGLVLDNLSQTDYGVNLGFGLEYSSFIGSTIGLEFQYSPSFHHVFDNGYLKVQNNTFEVLSCITF
jgi:hypothetical protein